MRLHVALAGSVVVSLSAYAEPKIAVLKFTGGKGAQAARSTVVEVLCEKVECVEPEKVTSHGATDWALAKKAGVGFVVAGAAAESDGSTQLTVRVLKGWSVMQSARVRLPPAGLSAAAVASLVNGVLSTVGVAATVSAKRLAPPAAADAAPASSDGPASTPSASAKAGPSASGGAAPATAEAPPPAKAAVASSTGASSPDAAASPGTLAPSSPPQPAAPPASAGASTVLEAPVAPVERPEQYRFAAEVGFNAYNRGFDYLGARVPDLRAYYLPMLALLTARLELFPFASAQGLHSWPGLELAASVAPWLRSAPPGSTESVPTFTSREDIALQWRFSPTGRLPLTLAPLVGFRHYVFAVTGLAPSGASLTGLPHLTYLAGRVGLAAELPFKERFVAFAKLYGMPIFSASQLIGPQYFPTGAAFGLEASGGAGVRLTRSLEARLSLDWTRYMFFFNTNIVTSRYYAGGAADQYLGATLVLRYFM